jgi:hypothetical protein
MKTCRSVFAILLCLGLGPALTASAQGSFDKYLAPADVEKVGGIKGARSIPRGSVAGAGGDLNFADDSGELVLMIQFADVKSFAGFKTKYARGVVSGVGDQAIQGASMPGMADNLLAFTKGARCVVLTAFGDFVNKKVYLTVDQLTALGRLIASRL